MSTEANPIILRDFVDRHIVILAIIFALAVVGALRFVADTRKTLSKIDAIKHTPTECITACAPLPVKEVRPKADRDDWCVCGEWR